METEITELFESIGIETETVNFSFLPIKTETIDDMNNIGSYNDIYFEMTLSGNNDEFAKYFEMINHSKINKINYRISNEKLFRAALKLDKLLYKIYFRASPNQNICLYE